MRQAQPMMGEASLYLLAPPQMTGLQAALEETARQNTSEQMSALERILEKARQHESLSRDEIVYLLRIRGKKQAEALFETARQLRAAHFGNKIFLYGFLYTSTYCRNNCRFCFYRADNRRSLRYRKTIAEVVDAARSLAESRVHLIDLTMGEDPHYLQDGRERLLHLVQSVKEATGLPVMVSPGPLPGQALTGLAKAGAAWYACYQETHNRSLFAQLRPGQDFSTRMNAKHLAHRAGLLIEEGVLAGVGESPEDTAESTAAMKLLDADQVRVMNFVPRIGTPMENFPDPDPLQELLTIAVLRLVFPDRLIPASLDVAGLAGLEKRLSAGANVVTSLVPPDRGLVGVARSYLDIDTARRSSAQVSAVLERCGLCAADSEDFHSWIGSRLAVIRADDFMEESRC